MSLIVFSTIKAADECDSALTCAGDACLSCADAGAEGMDCNKDHWACDTGDCFDRVVSIKTPVTSFEYFVDPMDNGSREESVGDFLYALKAGTTLKGKN